MVLVVDVGRACGISRRKSLGSNPMDELLNPTAIAYILA